MLDGLRDILQLIGGAVAITGGGIAAFKAINEIRLNREQRKLEFRWKQANAAKELLTDIHKNTFAANAVLMLDWRGGRHGYELPDASRASISWDDVCAALSREQSSCTTDTEIFVRDCFDWFFYFVDRIELYIEAGLIARRDVEMVFQPYAAIISEKKKMFSDFMEFHGYRLAMGYFKQYDGGPPFTEREGG